MRVGLYGGTFDPVHLGHLRMVIELAERCQLDQVWWVVAAASPFKMGETQTSAQHRLEMARLAIGTIAQFRALDLELQRPAPSYTIDTVELLRKNHPEHDFALLLGDDMMAGFPKWHRAEELVEQVELLVGRRGGRQPFPRTGARAVRLALRRGYTPTAVMEVSATEIRDRLQRGLYCGHLLPAAVLDYIMKNKLYGC
jgi:nicotinate-nucleotide adenylyltransferase